MTMIDTTIEALEKNRFNVFLADDPAHARRIVLEEIMPGLTPGMVSYGDSMTMHETRVLDDFRAMARDSESNAEEGGWSFLDTFEKGVEREEILERRRQALLSDLFLTGSNAVTTAGQLVNLDMIGNRVGGIVWGPRKVIIMVGTNKIVDGLDAAMDRVRTLAAPPNAKRHGKKTPCAKTGKCMDCKSPERICNVWTITEKSWPEGRISVVLIKGDYGL